ncbi:hypothetical protein AGIG_G23376 [Arapaima gigas]
MQGSSGLELVLEHGAEYSPGGIQIHRRAPEISVFKRNLSPGCCGLSLNRVLKLDFPHHRVPIRLSEKLRLAPLGGGSWIGQSAAGPLQKSST